MDVALWPFALSVLGACLAWTCVGPVYDATASVSSSVNWSCKVFVFLVFSISSSSHLFTSSSAGFPEPSEDGFDWDLPLRVKCYKIAHSLYIIMHSCFQKLKGKHGCGVLPSCDMDKMLLVYKCYCTFSTFITVPPCALYCFYFYPVFKKMPVFYFYYYSNTIRP